MSHQLYQRIYLSPHLDDAALSCGGLIYQQRQAGLSVLVVTVMAGDAPSDGRSSPIVDELHIRWGLGSNPNPAAARRAEDRRALSILKADLRHWEWPECVYRRRTESGDFLYPSEASLWGAVHPTEKELGARIARHLTDLPLVSRGQVYIPLTVGGHVDHHLVRQAAELWGAPGGEMIYFEEYPYAEHPEALAAVLKDGDKWRAELVPLDEDALKAKTTAVACYDSQISTFFADRDEIGARLHAYATLAGGGEWAERYWHRN